MQPNHQVVISNLLANVGKKIRRIAIALNVIEALSSVTEDDMTSGGTTTISTVRAALVAAAEPYYENTEFESLFYDTITQSSNYVRSFTFYCKIDTINAVIGLAGLTDLSDGMIDEEDSDIPIDSEALYELYIEGNVLQKQSYTTMTIAINDIISHTKLSIPIANLLKTVKAFIAPDLPPA